MATIAVGGGGRRGGVSALAWVVGLCMTPLPATAASGTPDRVTASSPGDAAEWGGRLAALVADGRLRLVRERPDEEFPGRMVRRYAYFVGDVRMFGPELVEHRDETGRTLAVFGGLVGPVDLDLRPRLRPEQAEATALARSGAGFLGATPAELVVVPPIPQLGIDRARLAYLVWTQSDLARRCFLVEGHDGSVLLDADDTQNQAVPGVGTGARQARRKVSVTRAASGEYRAADGLRPPAILTYDLGFDGAAYTRFLFEGRVDAERLARDADNDWRDAMVVDAHALLGWTYDYYFKRHGRRGLDDRDLRVMAFVHHSFFANASWNRLTRSMLFGDGAGRFGPFTSSLEVVAHEFTHGVTQFSWSALPVPQAGALNESFSDIMGLSVEWFYQPPGVGYDRADYWAGEDLGTGPFSPQTTAVRAPFDPSRICFFTASGVRCHPDHFSQYDVTSGVHANGSISSHAFYLLVEGGVNRTSGIRVGGLGGANREKAEKIFYRGFTAYLTPDATFLDARRATIQAARELYGASGPEAEQTALAWTAVGVVEP